MKRGDRVVHGDKELLEKLGRNDLCPCGSAKRFQEVLHGRRRLSTGPTATTIAAIDAVRFPRRHASTELEG